MKKRFQLLAFVAVFALLVTNINAQTPGPNILKNADFENGTSDWTARSCTIAEETSVVQNGSTSLSVTGRTKKWNGAAQFVTDSLIKYGQGDYVFRAYYHSMYNVAFTGKAQVKLTDDSGDSYVQALDAVEATGWYLVQDTVNITWSGNLNEARLTLMTKNNDTVSYYLDNTSIYKLDVSSSLNDKKEPVYPTKFQLDQNFPNPFNPETVISFSLPKNSKIQLTVYNMLGKEVALLADEVFSAGQHQIKFKANSLPSGVYVYRLKAGEFIQSRKMILLR